MKTSTVAVALFAALATASPVKRHITTELIIVTETVWVIPGQETDYKTAAPTTTEDNPYVVYVTVDPDSDQTAAATTAAPTYAAATSAAAASTSVAASVPAPAGTDYKSQVVYHHNVHRSNHSASDLAWDDGLASIAATIASSCVYAHDVTTGGGGFGQNIAAGVKPEDVSQVISNLFYDGEVGYFDGLYGQANPDMSQFEKWGHFSQIVWKSTSTVGCATQYCPNGLANTGSDVAPYFTVCNYKSPGNYGGEYAENISPPLGRAAVYG